MLRATLRPVVQAIRAVVGTRGLADGLARLERAVSAGASPSPAPAQLVDVNVLLHQSRGAMLREMPAGARRLLSAGCAGTWYFNWIEQTYGRVPEHVGIEFFEPEPPDLPDNVTWIANTASDMSAVEAATVDLIFSGQNLEHLWPEDVAGFVLEAARVLRPGGHLVMDSPNRLITAAQGWSHPQHTIELTCDEAAQLAQLAGFDVTALRGLWLCRDPKTGEDLPFDPNVRREDWSIPERLIHAREHPRDSFIWWLEASRTARAPDTDATRQYMADLFRRHWPERVQRLRSQPGHAIEASPDGDWVVSAPGLAGAALYGPYMPLKAGLHRVTWRFRPAPATTEVVAICDVLSDRDAEPLARRQVQGGETGVSLEFRLTEMTFGLQFRCLSQAGPGFSVLRRIELEEQIG